MRKILRAAFMPLAFFAAALTLPSPAWAKAASKESLDVKVSPQPLMSGEQAQLVISCNDKSHPQLVGMPAVDGIEWLQGSNRSMRTNIVNQNTTVVTESTYYFLPKKAGKITIPALDVQVGGKKLKTEPVELSVYERQFEGQAQGGQAKAVPVKDALFMKTFILSDKKEFYLGEEINLAIKLYSLNGVQMRPSWPDIDIDNAVFPDFSSVNKENPKFSSATQAQESIGGQVYNVFTFRTAFRPISEGVINIKADDKCEVVLPGQKQRGRTPFDDDDFFGGFMGFGRQNRTVKDVAAEPLPITVKPLPPPPEGTKYLGLVGQWRVKTELSSETLKAGEPVTLTVEAQGSGCLETFKAPAISLPGFRVYPPETDKMTSPGQETQKAAVRYVIIPLEEGPAKISEAWSYFAPSTGQYRTINFERIFTVAKGEAAPAALVVGSGSGADSGEQSKAQAAKEKKLSNIIYIKSAEGGEILVPLWRNHTALTLALLCLGPLAWGAIGWARVSRERLRSTPGLKRKMDALGRRAELISKLKKATHDDFADIVTKDVAPFLNDALMLPPGASPRDTAAKIEDKDAAAILESAAESSYMPGQAGRDWEKSRAALISLIKRLSCAAVLFSALILNGAETAAPASDFAEGCAAYNQSDFKKAAALFKKSVTAGAPAPAAIYNLGNAYCQTGDYPRALACYERASRLSPWDSDISENLNFACRKLSLPERGKIENPAGLIAWLRDCLRPDQWVLLAAFFCLAMFGMLAAARSVRVHNLKVIAAAPAAAALICAAAVTGQIFSSYSDTNAVVIEKNAPIYSLPSDKNGRVEAKLKPGESVRIEESQHGWLRVRSESGAGWVRDSDISRVWGDWSALP